MNHPLAYQRPFARGHMGGWLDDAWSNISSSVTDPLRDYTDQIIGTENREQLDKVLEEAYKQELDSAKKQAINQLREQVGLTPASGGSSTSTGGNIAQQLQNALANIQNSPVVASVPGGIYTLLGVTALGVYLLVRK